MIFWPLQLLIILWLSQSEAKFIRIIGGRPAYAGQFPYAAAITIQTSNGRHFCGGTLIDPEWILTAGQCIYEGTLFTINLGSNKMEGEDVNRVTVATSEYVLYPDFDPMTLANDIGLIKLRMPVEYNAYLNKVDFLGSFHVVQGTRLMAIGWGQTTDANPEFSNDLLLVTVSAMSNEECGLIYGNQIFNSTLCAEGNYNEGSCFGDTGSALLQDMGRGYISHVGIASFISMNGCESTDPSGYVRTYPYRDWIKNVTGI